MPPITTFSCLSSSVSTCLIGWVWSKVASVTLALWRFSSEVENEGGEQTRLPLDSCHTLLLELGILVNWNWHGTDKDFASFHAAIYLMLYYHYILIIYIYMVYTYSTCIRLVPCIVGGQKWFPMMNMIFLINTSRVRLVGPCLHTPSPNLTRNGDFWGGSFGQFVHEYVCKYVNACVYMYIYTCKLTDFDNQASLFLCRIWWSPWGSNWFQVASHVTSAAKGMLATPPRNSKFKGKWKPPGGQCYKMGELLKKIAIENLCLSW